jgi:hypothetical protein
VESTKEYHRCELVIADWQSNDWPLVDWVQQAASPVPTRLVTVEDHPFSRGKGCNVAATMAKGDALLFLDADCLLCASLIERGLECVRQGKAYFPIVFSFDGPEHGGGWWSDGGYGVCLLDNETYRLSGGWPEYNSWGNEDLDFFNRICSLVEAARERVPGFCHQWHPTDITWKDRYGDRPAGELLLMRQEQVGHEEALKRIKEAAQEIEQFIGLSEKYILVDEDWFGNVGQGISWSNSPVFSEGTAIPFLERNGQYWGPPEDDAMAIREFERLWRSGATFLVFAWPAFWWLDYYKGFHDYLRSRYGSTLQNERLIIFDLRE